MNKYLIITAYRNGVPRIGGAIWARSKGYAYQAAKLLGVRLVDLGRVVESEGWNTEPIFNELLN